MRNLDLKMKLFVISRLLTTIVVDFQRYVYWNNRHEIQLKMALNTNDDNSRKRTRERYNILQVHSLHNQKNRQRH